MLLLTAVMMMMMLLQEKFDAEPEHKRSFWKLMGANFLERYLCLLCVSAHLLDEAENPRGTFSEWMSAHSARDARGGGLRALIRDAKASFSWT
jgi:hypothetical protein